MKKTLLSFVVALLTVTGVSAQEWEWGTAKWNIEDGASYEGIADFNAKGGLVLSYPNPTDFYLTFLNIIAVTYDVQVDDATEVIQYTSTAQAGTDVAMTYPFIEGHTYHIRTTSAVLAQANLATYQTDTLSVSTDSYSISFSIDGPKFVKAFDVEATMSLAITDQNTIPTISKVDTTAIKNELGISSLSEAEVYALNPDGSYIGYEWHADVFDGWRDADGDYTNWGGGYDQYHGRNAFLAVYSIKLNATADSVSYYFYDRWSDYVEKTDSVVGGSGVEGTEVKAKAPVTNNQTIVWELEDEDGTIYKYNRNYRCEEGKDYKASFVYIANKKLVRLNATLHFVSQEDYDGYIQSVEDVAAPAIAPATEGIYSLSGVRLNSLQKGINIVKSADGSTRKVLVK